MTIATPKNVTVLDRTRRYDGFFKIDTLRLSHDLFSGQHSSPLTRELMVRGDAVAVLPYDPLTDRVVLIEQFRVGALDHSENPWLIELIAGMMDKQGEDPQTVTRREALEEANLTLGTVIPICSYYPSPGSTNERIHLFIAGCDSRSAGGLHGLASEHEDIQSHVWDFNDALAAMSTGRINNAASIIALQWLALNKAFVLTQL